MHWICVKGSEFKPHIEKLGGLRLKVFNEWPYLYEGDLEYEVGYLGRYAEAKNSFAVLAFEGEELIGATTAIYLPEEEELAFKKPFLDQGYSVDQVVYFGESILLKDYRGAGLGKIFMEKRLEFAAGLPQVKYVGFCSVIRDQNHNLRPTDYRPLDSFWSKVGFKKIEGMLARYPWKDLDQDVETEKQLQYWVMELQAAK